MTNAKAHVKYQNVERKWDILDKHTNKVSYKLQF